jgi:homoserine O-acetyltransferase/O-succinyltransferase
MKARRHFLLAFLVLAARSPSALAQNGEPQFASLGDFKLQSGEVLRECRIGYRTFGTLNADRSNAVLFPTWASGTSEQLAGSIGPGRLADSSKFFVVAVDALANGVSSPPPTARRSPG